MVDLLLSAAHGVPECQLGLVHLERRLRAEALPLGVRVQRLQAEPSPHGFHSLRLRLVGEQAEALAGRWLGTVQWQWASRLRPGHRRKNWFLGVFRLEDEALPPGPGDFRPVASPGKARGKEALRLERWPGPGQKNNPGKGTKRFGLRTQGKGSAAFSSGWGKRFGFSSGVSFRGSASRWKAVKERSAAVGIAKGEALRCGRGV